MAIINPWIFYLIDLLSSLKDISGTVAVIGLFVTIIVGIITMVVKVDAWYDDDSARFVAQSIKVLKKVIDCYMHLYWCIHNHSFRGNHVQDARRSVCHIRER